MKSVPQQLKTDGTDEALFGSSWWAIAANSVTIARLVASPLVAWMIIHKNPWWLSFFLGLFLGFTDYLDGRLARMAKPTKFGAFTDPLADKLVVLFAGFALVSIGVYHWIPMGLILVREVGIQGYRTFWAGRGLSIPARKSGKYKATVQGIAILVAVCPAVVDMNWLIQGSLWLAVAFTLFSGAQYVVDGRDALRTTGER